MSASSHRFAKLTIDDLRTIGAEVKGAIGSGIAGFSASERFLTNTPTMRREFARYVSRTKLLRDLRLDMRTKPPYWVVDRAATVFLNNSVKGVRRKNAKSPGEPQKVTDQPAGAQPACPPSTQQPDPQAAPEEVRESATVDSASPSRGSTASTASTIPGIDSGDFEVGTVLGFLPREQARLSGVLDPNTDCTTPKGNDPLCILTVDEARESLHGRCPPDGFVVSCISKVNGAFPRAKVPWLELYPQAALEEIEHTNCLLQTGQYYFWERDALWEVQPSNAVEKYRIKLPALEPTSSRKRKRTGKGSG